MISLDDRPVGGLDTWLLLRDELSVALCFVFDFFTTLLIAKCRTFETKGVETRDTRSMPNPSGLDFWKVMLNKPLDWITPCFESLRTESAMLCKPQCCRLASPCVKSSKLLNFAIYRARIGWNATCSGPARLPPTRCASTPSGSAVGASSVVEPWPQQTGYWDGGHSQLRILLQCPKRRQCEQCHETDEPTSPT